MSHNATELLNELREKYSEYIEMAGENSPALMNQILASLLFKEIEEKEYYKKIAYSRQKQTIKI